MHTTEIRQARQRTARPKLTAENAVAYLDWIMENLGSFSKGEELLHMQAAELAIRTKANEAQAKDTQHTLVRDGVMEAPVL